MTPWDTTFFETSLSALAQFSTRHFMIPPSNGIDYRVLNGYVYVTPVPAPEEDIAKRAELFEERAGYYYQNWDRLYDQWLAKVQDAIHQVSELRFEPLPEMEEMSVITTGAGKGSGYDLMASYHRLLDYALLLNQYHMEFLNLGYAAYLDFFGFCKQKFPSMSDLSVSKMVAGIEVDLFRPDDELKKLARLAVDRGIEKKIDADDVQGTWQRLEADKNGREWIAAWHEAAEPWFNFTNGTGLDHRDKIWIEHPEVPFGYILDYVEKVKNGAEIDRPIGDLHAERDRIISEYRNLLEEEDRPAFDNKLELIHTVFPYVENHNFYIHYWAHAMIYRRMRDLGRVLQHGDFIDEPNDIFMYQQSEISDVLWDLYSGWAAGVEPRGVKYWRPEIRRRRRIQKVLEEWQAPPALGSAPKVITDPFTIMLWGITDDSLSKLLGTGHADDDGTISGFAGSPGVAEGPARVVTSSEQIHEIREGEILVSPLTSPSWAPAFAKIKATVTDVGGIMSHAAIVCREYGLPAVIGTTSATTTIKTGQRIRVDGDSGTVTLLE